MPPSKKTAAASGGATGVGLPGQTGTKPRAKRGTSTGRKGGTATSKARGTAARGTSRARGTSAPQTDGGQQAQGGVATLIQQAQMPTGIIAQQSLSARQQKQITNVHGLIGQLGALQAQLSHIALGMQYQNTGQVNDLMQGFWTNYQNFQSELVQSFQQGGS